MSSEFELLSEGVKRWIYNQGWDSLHDVQRRSIPAVLSGNSDVLITAPTAGGKTEAAFLPAISEIEKNPPSNSYGILSISPLKALINDQCFRLTSVCASAGVKITPWHGDVSRSIKSLSWRNPSGLLLITPESLEGLLIRTPETVRRRLKDLRYVVIDEYHSFMGTSRGYQLISQLNRLDALLGRRVCRIALSATIGSPESALRFLRGEQTSCTPTHINSEPLGKKLRINLRGYAPKNRKALPHIAQDLWGIFRGSNNIVFTGSRSMVEVLTNAMSGYCDARNLPNEFFAHHGSMNKNQREDLEARLRDGKLPTTAIATTTLELGIDLGTVASVAHVGAPTSVSSLRQQLGRSGRRGGSSTLRVLVPSNACGKDATPVERLSLGLFQAIAVVELMLTRWYEPTDLSKYELSTIVQQIMALSVQYSGLKIAQLYNLLCEIGPWPALTPDLFIEILKSLSISEAIVQTEGGDIILGSLGEKIVGDRSFVTSFAVPEEYSLIYNGKEIGRIPVEDNFLSAGQGLLFGGISWKIITISQPDSTIQLDRGRSGVPPSFSGIGPPVHQNIRNKVAELYMSDCLPDYLDDEAIKLIKYGRDTFQELDMNNMPIHVVRNHLFWVVFASTKVVNTLCVFLTWLDFEVIRGDPVIYIDLGDSEVIEPEELIETMYQLMAHTDEDAFMSKMPPLELGKYDYLLSSKLRQKAYGAELTDQHSTLAYLKGLIK